MRPAGDGLSVPGSASPPAFPPRSRRLCDRPRPELGVPKLLLRSMSAISRLVLMLFLAAMAFCSKGEAEGENGLPVALPLPRLGLRKGDRAELGLKFREVESGEEE